VQYFLTKIKLRKFESCKLPHCRIWIFSMYYFVSTEYIDRSLPVQPINCYQKPELPEPYTFRFFKHHFIRTNARPQAISTGWRSQRWTGDKARNRKYESKCMLSQYICSNTAISRRYSTVARNASAGHSLRNIFRCIRSPSCVYCTVYF